MKNKELATKLIEDDADAEIEFGEDSFTNETAGLVGEDDGTQIHVKMNDGLSFGLIGTGSDRFSLIDKLKDAKTVVVNDDNTITIDGAVLMVYPEGPVSYVS